MDETELLELIRGRRSPDSFGYGIATADSYLKGIAASIGDASRLLDGISPAAWDAMLKDSAGQLTYSNDQLDVVEKATGGFDSFLTRLKDGPVTVPMHTAMVFENVLTSTREDRDRDVMESDGAVLDPRMLLLWQHIPLQPIGKMLGVVSRTKDWVKVVSCLLDLNQTSADAIKLVEADALRISHGFKPKKFKPLPRPSDQKDDRPMGFRVESFEVVEESLVSVPSNTDAVITLYSRGKLTSPLVKGWAKSQFDARPAVAPGYRVVERTGDSERSIEFGDAATLKEYLADDKAAKKRKPKPESDDVVACPECGVEVKTEMTECPECGASLRPKAAKPQKPEKPEQVKFNQHHDDKGRFAVKPPSPAIRELMRRIESAIAPPTADDDSDDAKALDFSLSHVADGDEAVLVLHAHKGDAPRFCQPDVITKAYVQLQGSWEAITDELRRGLKKYLTLYAAEIGVGSDYFYPRIEAMYDDHAIVLIDGMRESSPPNGKAFRIGWKSTKGTPVWDGAPKEVEIAATVTEKMIRTERYSVGSLARSIAIASLDVGLQDIGDLQSIKSVVGTALAELQAARLRSEEDAAANELLKFLT